MKQPTKTNRLRTLSGATALAAAFAVSSAFAASQTWTNAPTDQNWNTTNNWVGLGVPGGINMSGNTVNNDTVTFNSAISGIGGAGAPVLIDDATVVNARSRQVGSIIFDTASCGAYVFSSASGEALPTETTPETGILNVSHNGSITINADVQNSQVFHVPVYTRLPSSTPGVYSFVNNATDPSVTLTFDRVVNNSASTRGTDFHLGGSNTGANTISYLSAGTTDGGVNGVTKEGSGTWILTSENDFRTQTTIQILDGTLIAQDYGVFGDAENLTISGSGVLQIDAVELYQTTVNLNNGGTIRMNGSSDVIGVLVGSDAGTEATLATTSASDVFQVGTGAYANSYIEGGAADTVLHTAGPGTISLGTANPYVGNWSFDAGTVQLATSDALGTGASANVGAGAVFDFSPLGGTTYVPSVDGFGGSGTGTTAGTMAAITGDASATLDLSGKAINLTFTPASISGDTTHPALVMTQGTLQLGGNTVFVNNASGSPLGVGTYRLVQQSAGSITSGGGYAALISGSGVADGTSASIAVSGGNVDLVVVAYVSKDLVWSGTGATWDLGSSSDWLDGGSPSVFNNSDNATFNSTGSANPNVNLVGTLAPASVVVDTSANDYSFSGSGQIAGTGSLVKNSTGTLTLGTANTYAGGTVVNGGTLRLGTAEAISSTGSGDVTVVSGATLDLNGNNNTVNALQGAGTVDEQSGGDSVLTVGNSDQDGSFGGVIKNTSGTVSLTKVGTGTQSLSGANSFSGAATVSAGTLSVSDPHGLGAGNLVLNAGTVSFQNDLQLTSLTGTGGAITTDTAGTNTLTVTITNDIVASTAAGINDNAGVGGVVALVVDGAGTLQMNAAGTYSGGTLLLAGTNYVHYRDAGDALGTGPVTLQGGLLKLYNGMSLRNRVIVTSEEQIDFWGNIYLNCALTGDSNSILHFSNLELIGNTITPQSGCDFSDFHGTLVMDNTALEYLRMDGSVGGTDTTFNLGTNSWMVQRSANRTTIIGHLIGGDQTQVQGNGATTYILGGKNLNGSYPGAILNGTITLIKEGTGTFSLTGSNLWTGGTIISNGVLALSGVEGNPTNTTAVTVLAPGSLDVSGLTGSTLYLATTNPLTIGGDGTITGSVLVDAAVPAVAVTPGASIGTLTLSGALTLNANSAITAEVATGNLSDQIAASGITLSGASITVTNVGGSALHAGDTFQLFSQAVSDAGSVNLPTADAYGTYTWTDNLASDGTVSVATAVPNVNTESPTLDVTYDPATKELQIQWPADRTGWSLQAQTNSLSTGLSNDWTTVTGTDGNNTYTVIVDQNDPTVFYRLTYQISQ